MNPSMRVRLVSASVIVTVIYSVLIALDESIAQSLMLGYCGIVLTLVAIDYRYRRHHEP